MKTNKFKLSPIVIAVVFAAVSAFAVFIPTTSVAEASTSSAAAAKAKCETRVKKINNRGKKMAKKSKAIQTKYKNANAGWKQRVTKNKKVAVKYAADPRLKAPADNMNAKVTEFRNATKAYNNAKRPYIQERNAQVKSYKNFKADCNTPAGRSAALNKMRAWQNTDSKELKQKADAVSQVYKSQVRPAIQAIGESRKALSEARKSVSGGVRIASAAVVDSSVTPEDENLDDVIDEDFEEEEYDDDLENEEEPL